MTGNTAQVAGTPTPVWPMYRALVGIGMLCALGLVLAFQVTRPVIQRNRVAAIERAIFRVMPAAHTQVPYRLSLAGLEPAGITGDDPELVFACYDESERLIGFAIPAEGMGYQDVIRLLYGYTPETETIIGISVLESRETPGLGTKIETDPRFLASLAALDVSLAPDGATLANPVAVVAAGERSEPWQIDGITGATISSKAVGRILREDTAARLPLLRRHLGRIEQREAP